MRRVAEPPKMYLFIKKSTGNDEVSRHKFFFNGHHPNVLTFFLEIKSGGEGDLGNYELYESNSVMVTENLDRKLYGNNRNELENLRLIRHELNLTEISECDDSTDTENITLSRVNEITTREIAKYEFLTQNRNSNSETSPPNKKSRIKGDDDSSGDRNLKINIPSSICDETSDEIITPVSKPSARSLKFKQTLKAEINKVHLLPKFFRTEIANKHSPRILDLELLSNINSTPSYKPTTVRTTNFWNNDSHDFVDNTTRSSAESERFFVVDDYNQLCTGLEVPKLRRIKENFPAITKITTHHHIDDSSSCCCWSHDFECIYDAFNGYGDVKIDDSPKPEEATFDGDDYVSYKHVVGNISSGDVVEKVVKPSAIAGALMFRETQSTELPFYDVASVSTDDDEESVTLVSESDDLGVGKKGNVWWKCSCFNVLFRRRKLDL